MKGDTLQAYQKD